MRPRSDAGDSSKAGGGRECPAQSRDVGPAVEERPFGVCPELAAGPRELLGGAALSALRSAFFCWRASAPEVRLCPLQHSHPCGRHPIERSIPNLFHELDQVVQYRKVGLSDFAARYVTRFLRGGSYQRIPLEINAYQLDAEYTRNPKRQFAVEERVQAWIEEGRF